MELSRAAMLLSLLLWSFFGTTSAAGNETDRLSLLEFKAKVTADSLGVLKAWNKSTHFCEWPGVTCGRRHQRVTSLVIKSSQLSGHLSPFIGNLSFLRILILDNNSFSHHIPEEIGRLHRLRGLNMDDNSFNGTIPTNISRCFSLQHLFLQTNKLVGVIPSEIGSLRNLKRLALYGNDLHGEIPISVANLSNLSAIAVGQNHLSGHIPSSLGQLKMMNFLELGDNKFSGIVPPSIYNLSLIRHLSVLSNELHGEIPSRLFLPKLETFRFHNNQFSGLFPDISNASNLIELEIGNNNLTGKVPRFSNLPNLKMLDLQENILGSGEEGDLDFFSSVVNSTNLENIGISRNNFGGKLPECVANFSTNIREMTFGDNRIKGSIPNGIGNLVNLENLGFEYNQMTGPIPSSFGKLKRLGRINLNNNKLSHTIPSSIGNLSSLIILNLGSNNLTGVVPSSLGNCKTLTYLSLSGNNVSGSIPKKVVSLSSISQGLDFSDNHFIGSIPSEVGRLVNLGFLDFSNNKLSGEIPESLGMCEVLEYLSLGRNSLQGSIPKSIAALQGLSEIDFSRNNLSGKLPTNLENLHLLQLANFSFNNFEGEIPTKGIFTNASAFTVEGNSRLCGGIAKLGLRKCPSKSNKKHKQSFKLIMSVVSGLVAILILALLSGLLLQTRKRTRKAINESALGVSFLEVSYADLLNATDGFCAIKLIGTGSFGSVYKADILTQNSPLAVAVKVLNLQVSRALKSFISECKVLGSIKHRNIVKLITACSSIDFQGNEFKALVYEFVINGSLEEWLHPRHAESSEQGKHLNFIQRINIAIDVAHAIDHLHNNSHVQVVHSDLKPSNILLDSDMIARVGDFGLARFLEDPSQQVSVNQSSSLGIKGSIGYIAPEYSMGVLISRAGDVYSYGILLLEMFTGKRPTDETFIDSLNLHSFVKNSLPERLPEIVDSTLLVGADQVEEQSVVIREESHERNNVGASEIRHISFWKCLESILSIGVSCSEERPNERMNIDDVVKELQHIKTAYTRN